MIKQSLAFIFAFSFALSAHSAPKKLYAAGARHTRTQTSPASSSSSDSSYSSSPSYYSGSSSSDSMHHVSALLGLMAPGMNALTGTANSVVVTADPGFALSGFFAIGGDYEFTLSSDFTVGGIFRYYSVSTTLNGATVKNSLLAIGPIVRANINLDHWIIGIDTGLPYLSPSLTVANTDVNIDGAFGMRLGISFLYKFNSNVSLGIENGKLIGMSNKLNGILTDDYMLKARFAL